MIKYPSGLRPSEELPLQLLLHGAMVHRYLRLSTWMTLKGHLPDRWTLDVKSWRRCSDVGEAPTRSFPLRHSTETEVKCDTQFLVDYLLWNSSPRSVHCRSEVLRVTPQELFGGLGTLGAKRSVVFTDLIIFTHRVNGPYWLNNHQKSNHFRSWNCSVIVPFID